MTVDEALMVGYEPHDHEYLYDAWKVLAAEVRRLRAAIEDIGEQGDVCTFGYTRQICNNCRCKKKPLPEGPGG